MEHIWSAQKYSETHELALANPDTRTTSWSNPSKEPPNPVLQGIEAEIKVIKIAKQKVLLEQLVELAKFKIALVIAEAARYSKSRKPIESAINFLYRGSDDEIDPIRTELHSRLCELVTEAAETGGYKVVYSTKVEYVHAIHGPGQNVEMIRFTLECV